MRLINTYMARESYLIGEVINFENQVETVPIRTTGSTISVNAPTRRRYKVDFRTTNKIYAQNIKETIIRQETLVLDGMDMPDGTRMKIIINHGDIVAFTYDTMTNDSGFFEQIFSIVTLRLSCALKEDRPNNSYTDIN